MYQALRLGRVLALLPPPASCCQEATRNGTKPWFPDPTKENRIGSPAPSSLTQPQPQQAFEKQTCGWGHRCSPSPHPCECVSVYVCFCLSNYFLKSNITLLHQYYIKIGLSSHRHITTLFQNEFFSVLTHSGGKCLIRRVSNVLSVSTPTLSSFQSVI